MEGNGPAGNALDEHARRTPRGAPQLQRLDQDGPLGIRRPRLVEAASASDPLRDRPQAAQLPDTAAWSFVYASILANTGRSSAEGYGPQFAANVVEPPTIPRTTAEEMERLMAAARATGSPQAEEQAAAECARLARTASRIATGGLRSETARRWLDEQYQAWRQATGTTSHDAFLADRACACMKRFSPRVMSVDFGEIDCAHYGSWSRYVEAIRRTDQLTWQLWQAAETLPGYRGATLMLVLPDHGRERRPARPKRFHPSQRFLHGPRGRRGLPPHLDAGHRARREAGPGDRPAPADHCRSGRRSSLPRPGGVPRRGPAGSGCLAGPTARNSGLLTEFQRMDLLRRLRILDLPGR